MILTASVRPFSSSTLHNINYTIILRGDKFYRFKFSENWPDETTNPA